MGFKGGILCCSVCYKDPTHGQIVSSTPLCYGSQNLASPYIPTSSASVSAQAKWVLFYQTKLCSEFKSGACAFIRRSIVAHGVQERRTTPSVWDKIVSAPGCGDSIVGGGVQRRKTKMCRYFLDGNRPYGDTSKFLHGNDEAQKTKEIEVQGAVNAAAGRVGSGGLTSLKPLYKTSLCAKWEKAEPCHFAHGPAGKAMKGKREKIFTGTDVALGGINVFGWSVEVEGKGEVGKVVEILHIGRPGSIGEDATYEYVLKVSQSEVRSKELDLTSRSEHFATEMLLPIVDEFVEHVDAKQKRLLVKPPEGLLELSERPEAIRRLLPEIQQFCQRHARFLQERFPGNKKIKYDSSADLQQMVHMYMPTREQLQAVGRFDLARRIKAAGGFLFVAQSLGLKSTRRPNGFWDDLEKLDNAIEQFLWESWVQKVHQETGKIYFENVATKDVALERPIRSSGLQSSLSGHEVSRVMPQQVMLWKAHRWDLHHAIVWNGGYKEVARALGRSLLRTSQKLRQKQQESISLLGKNYASSRESIEKADLSG